MGLSVGSGLGEERTEGPRGTPRRGVTGTPGRGLEAVTRGSGAAPSESRRLWEPRPLIYYFIPTLRRLGPRLKPATRVRALDPEWPLWPFRACGRSVHPAAPAGPRRLQAPWPRAPCSSCQSRWFSGHGRHPLPTTREDGAPGKQAKERKSHRPPPLRPPFCSKQLRPLRTAPPRVHRGCTSPAPGLRGWPGAAWAPGPRNAASHAAGVSAAETRARLKAGRRAQVSCL